MILDQNTTFVDAADLTAAVASDVIDLSVDNDVGIGESVGLYIMTSPDTAGLTALTVTVREADAGAMTTPTVLVSTGDMKGTLNGGGVGTVLNLPRTSKRYLDVAVTATGATAGTISIGLAVDIQTNG